MGIFGAVTIPMPGLNIEVVKHDHSTRVRVQGEIDSATAAGLRDTLFGLVDSNTEEVVVDLSEVGLLDSNGLGTLVGTHRRLTEKRHRLVLEHPQPAVAKLLEQSGLDRIIAVRR